MPVSRADSGELCQTARDFDFLETGFGASEIY